MRPEDARLDVKAGDDGDVGEDFGLGNGFLKLMSEAGTVSGPLEVIAFARTQIFLGMRQ